MTFCPTVEPAVTSACSPRSPWRPAALLAAFSAEQSDLPLQIAAPLNKRPLNIRPQRE
jgi:hypothetical protein